MRAQVVDVPQSKEKEETRVAAAPQGVIATLKHRTQRTSQESLIASLLLELGYRHEEQWLLVVEGERLLFDFQVEDQVLLECMISTSNSCAQAWSTLRRRLAYLDFKFRLAKKVATFTTVVLTEAVNCPRPRFPFPQTLSHLPSTDYVVTTFPELGRLLIDLMSTNPRAARDPGSQQMLSRWLASGSETSHRRNRRQ